MSKSGIPIVSDVAKAVKPLVPFASAILPFIPIPGFAGLSPLLTKSLLAGGIGGLSGGKGKFDAKRALTSGLLSYGLGSLAQGSGAAGSAGSVSGSAAGQGLASNIDPAALEGMSASQVASQVAAMPSTAGAGLVTGAGAGQGLASNIDPAALERMSAADVAKQVSGMPMPPPAATAPMQFRTQLPTGSGVMDYVKQTGENIGAAARGVGSAVTGAPGAMDAFRAAMPINPLTGKPIGAAGAAGTAFAGYTGTKAIDELNKQKAEAERILANIEGRKQADIDWAKGVMRDYPMIYQRLTEEDVRSRGFAGGGIANLAMAGGGQPRFLSGGGDGMSDSIPASIEGKQPARLADGEFVVPADVVSHIGNGSSKAGAQKLYKMMDRVRMARTGKKRQAPEVKTERYMPA